MGFVADILDAIVDVLIIVYETVVQIVEVVIQLVMLALGLVEGQTVEYFEVKNILLFEDVKNNSKNPLLSIILASVIGGTDISKDLLYAMVYRSLKNKFGAFMKYIDDGNYFESFPVIESYILVINYTELTSVLTTLSGSPATPGVSKLRALDTNTWIKYWLQENKAYIYDTNTLIDEYASTSTSPITPAATIVGINHVLTITDEIATEDSFVVNAEAPVTTSPITPAATVVVINYIISIADEIATADNFASEGPWQVDFTATVYNSGPDTYSIGVFTDGGSTKTLSYTVPSKPLQLHYEVIYSIDSNPTVDLLFTYKVGTGTYTNLDTVENAIDIDGTVLEVVPDIPLRISNSDYTTFGATKSDAIEKILELVDLDAAKILNAILTDTGLAPGDIDNIYIKFGVRMFDTSQIGMKYLLLLCENLFSTQGVTKGTYDATPAIDEKPTNKVIVTTADSKYIFQFNYITYVFTTLAAIDADSGSTENGVYYSNLTKFKNGLLVYPYYASSGKAAYNVGYVADTLAEVALFLRPTTVVITPSTNHFDVVITETMALSDSVTVGGILRTSSGIVNPGTVTGEAANWLQVTTRMKYNKPTPVLQDPDGTVSDLIYLTGDMVYENNGSGVLRIVEKASEETTSGQSITYYKITKTGLDAYTIAAPIGVLKVIDGDSGVFKVVKFNLGNKDDLMVPFIHTFIKDDPFSDITKLFLEGIHASIYIAHYEVIEIPDWVQLAAIVIIIIIVVVIVVSLGSATEAALTAAEIAVAAVTTAVTATAASLTYAAMIAIIKTILINMLVRYVVQEIAKRDENLAMLVGIGIAIGFGLSGGVSLTGLDYANIAVNALDTFNFVQSIKIQRIEEELQLDKEKFAEERDGKIQELEDLYRDIYDGGPNYEFSGLSAEKRAQLNPMYPEGIYAIYNGQTESQYLLYEQNSLIDLQVSGESNYI